AFSETERYDYEENLKNYLDWFNVMLTAKNEGIAEGWEEGRAKGLAEGLAEGETIGLQKGRAEGEAIGILKTAKKMKDEGVDVNVISKFTDLPIEEIEKL
ncbi:MAG: hypothetical protein J6Q03_02175, partial [Paludibacteraceae bacterium]|nr:hypothetical protein [Paludibacteraceae bacterium]MEE0998006.1 hypothetical protein [Paludibacteraceae bacterium]